MKINIVLHNIRSVYNVGAILRTAEGIGVERVIYSGYTPRYNDMNLLPHLREKLNRQIAKSALGAELLVPQLNLSDLRDNPDPILKNPHFDPQNPNFTTKLLTNYIKCAIIKEYKVVGLENNLSSDEQTRQIILGQSTTSDGQEVNLGGQILLLLGEEVHGIPPEIRSQMDYFLEIPMHGQKESFNVSVATGIALWGLTNLY